MNKPRFGVYQHAIWVVTDHATGEGYAHETNGGLVVRPVGYYVPYGRMVPVKAYNSEKLARKYADKQGTS